MPLQPTSAATRPDRRSEPSTGGAVPIAVRGWTERTTKTGTPRTPGRPPRTVKRAFPHEALVFDTETLDEPGQRLMVGVWRLYSDDIGNPPGRTCVEEGLFYPDDLPSRDPAGWRILTDYAQCQQANVAAGRLPRLALMPLSQWLEVRFYRYGYRHRNRCAVVGFNLPFDLGAIAQFYAPARRQPFRGGWSLAFWGHTDPDKPDSWRDEPFHPWLRMKSIDPRRTLFGWSEPFMGDPDNWQQPGRFVDLRTLTFALTDRSYSLERACEAFGDPFEKQPVTYGSISTDMLTYARADVGRTATLYQGCMAELALHRGIDLQPEKLYSPASVGAAYLAAMGVARPLPKYQANGEIGPELLGWVMGAFYGGRAEARIVRAPMPVVMTDFTSMYPAQNALLHTWPLLTAAHLLTSDVTAAVDALVREPNLTDWLFDPQTWSRDIGVTFVELTGIAGAVLPVRAAYQPAPAEASPDALGALNIGVNPLHYDGSLWFALPDVLAAALLGPATFTITRAIRLRPKGTQAGLRSVQLRGGQDVDPATDNPFVAMIEGRHTARNNAQLAEAERQRLDQFLKITANATSYGSLARFDRRDLAKPMKLRAYGPMTGPLDTATRNPEDPGPYCFPPVAAAITAGARLMLALLERTLTDLGGSYVFMDTDSAAIVATPDGGPVPCPGEPDGTLHAISHAQVYELLRRFTPLNPFGPAVANPDPALPDCPWKIEKDSTTRTVHAYAIATKRYALYQPTAGSAQLVSVADGAEESEEDGDEQSGGMDVLEGGTAFESWSEHGLGLYFDPYDSDRSRDDAGKRIWMREAWQQILNRALGHETPERSWASQFALTQFTASSPTQLEWFATPTRGPVRGDRPRPASFGMLAQADPVLYGTNPPLPAAPFSNEPDQWTDLPWRDRRTRQPLDVQAASARPDRLAQQLADGAVLVRTLGQIVARYPLRPEHKSLAPDGAPASEDTRGKLRRRPVYATPATTRVIGKEGNKLSERVTGLVDDGSAVAVYGTVTDRWGATVLPALRAMGAPAVAVALGVSERTVRRWYAGASPHEGPSQHAQRAAEVAAEWDARPD